MESGKHIIGNRYGRLLVVYREERRGHDWFYLCRCDCGKEKLISKGNLVGGEIISCGCYRKEKTGEGNKTRIWTERSRSVASASHRGARWNETQREKMKAVRATRVGEKAPYWKGGIALRNRGLRYIIDASLKYKTWKDSVLFRDRFTCQDCGDKNNIEVHHITPYYKIRDKYNITTKEQAFSCEELWNIWNGITLCGKCHKMQHASKRNK